MSGGEGLECEQPAGLDVIKTGVLDTEGLSGPRPANGDLPCRRIPDFPHIAGSSLLFCLS